MPQLCNAVLEEWSGDGVLSCSPVRCCRVRSGSVRRCCKLRRAVGLVAPTFADDADGPYRVSESWKAARHGHLLDGGCGGGEEGTITDQSSDVAVAVIVSAVVAVVVVVVVVVFVVALVVCVCVCKP